MKSVLRFLIQLGVILVAIWFIVKYTTFDDKIISFFRANSNSQTGGITTGDVTSCTTPWGVKIPDESSIYGYWKDSNGNCSEELRTCDSGTLSGSYPYASCNDSSNPGNGGSNGQGASCTTPWGEMLGDGAYIIAYENTQSCKFEKRYCENGSLGGSYTATHCNSPIGMTQAPTNPVQVITNSMIGYGYIQAEQTANTQYDGPSRTSTNGSTTVISSWNNNKYNPTSISANDTNYIRPIVYKNYDLTQHGCTSPWGTFMDSSTWVIAYKSATPRPGGSCEYERRTCLQGTLGGSYIYPSCSLSDSSTIYNNYGQDYFIPSSSTSNARSCVTPWGQTIKDGNFVMAYRTSSAGSNYTCQGEYRYCRNGKMDGSYQYQTCNTNGNYNGNNNNNNNNRCSLPWGGTVPNGGTVFAYSTPYGNCNSQKRTCVNGYLQGSYQYSTCQSDNNWPNSCPYGNCGNNNNNNRSCSTPWGTTISNGTTVTAYSSTNGPCNSQTRTCSNGYLNGSYQYSYCNGNNDNGSCNGGNCGGNHTPIYNTCTTPWGQTLKHGEKVEAYLNASAPCYKQTRTCNNGNLDGSYTYNYCDASGPTTTTPGVDTYGSWQPAGDHEGTIDSLDTCNANATASYLCGTNNTNSCTDYHKINCTSFSPMICSYESRTVSCTN